MRRGAPLSTLPCCAIVAGATMTHSLVPPTPGPLFAANELGVDLSVMMLHGSIIGAIAAPAFAHKPGQQATTEKPFPPKDFWDQQQKNSS